MPGKNLFICCTPLQGLIAQKIIAHERLAPQDCVVFFFTSVDNEKYRSAYEKLRALCGDGEYFVWRPDFPRYVLHARQFFLAHPAENFYFASIDSIFVQLALSLARSKRIFTFDDGTANILPSSRYKQGVAPRRTKRLAFWLLGNRYSSRRVLREIVRHYTIYGDHPNICERLVPLRLLTLDVEGPRGEEECTVVIGGVVRELVSLEAARVTSDKLLARINRLPGEVFYIPHPREIDVQHGKARLIAESEIAEMILLNLLKRYGRVNVLGFGSTAQINLARVPGICNHYFTFSGAPAWLAEVRGVEEQITGRPVNLLDLDAVEET